MKTLSILVFLSVFSSCDKDEVFSKQELSFEIINETELDYVDIKIYSGQDVTDRGFSFADSISFSLESMASKTVNWKPMLLNSGGEGELLIKLTENHKEYFGYYSGRNISGSPYFTITIRSDVDIRQK